MDKQNKALKVPHNLEAERALLGSILLDNAALNAAVETISKDDFYSEAHRLTYGSMLAISEHGRLIDLVTLSEELGKMELVEKAGGEAYLAALPDGAPIGATTGIREYCRIVKEKSDLRKLLNISQNVTARVLEDADEAADLIELAQSEIFAIGDRSARSGFQDIRGIYTASWPRIQAMMENGLQISGVRSGLVELDNMTSGFQRGELVIIAARPSLGKTALALNIAAHCSLNGGSRVGIFSLEMNKESLLTRLLCAEARIDSHKMRTGFCGREDWGRATLALGRLSEAKIHIDDTAALSVMQIRAKARRLKAEHGLDLLIVDYLQLISGTGENRTQEVSYISRGLKAIAKELDVPVLALSQLSRAPEIGHGRKPQLSDLRESGSIEQDSDAVIFIYRPKLCKDEEPNEHGDLMRLIVAKQRNGPTGEIPVVFIRWFAKFENAATEYGEENQVSVP